MKCPKCEKENTNNSNVCEYCGSEMFDAVDTQTVEKQDEAPKEKSKKKVIVAVVAVIVAVALAVTGVLYILIEKEKQRQQDAKTGVTISDFSENVKELSVDETDDGMIGRYSHYNEKITVIADEYGNVREITLTCYDIDMTPGSCGYEYLMSLTPDKLDMKYFGGMVQDELDIAAFVLLGANIYELCADMPITGAVSYETVNTVLAMVNNETEVNDWVMVITYNDDSLTLEADYVG
jgi:hypothetical protein